MVLRLLHELHPWGSKLVNFSKPLRIASLMFLQQSPNEATTWWGRFRVQGFGHRVRGSFLLSGFLLFNGTQF